MIKNHDLIDRFFRYVKIDTQSAEDTGTQPSTAKQHDLAKLLYKELHEMGVEAHYDRKNCYVYAKLPGEEPAIGFIAHMDTSPAASGANVHPRIEENYQGHSIVLFKGHAGSESIVMRHEAFPELQNHIGEDLIVTDGKTLLLRRTRRSAPASTTLIRSSSARGKHIPSTAANSARSNTSVSTLPQRVWRSRAGVYTPETPKTRCSALFWSAWSLTLCSRLRSARSTLKGTRVSIISAAWMDVWTTRSSNTSYATTTMTSSRPGKSI